MAMPSKQFRAKTLMFIRGPQPRGWRKEAGWGDFVGVGEGNGNR